MAGGTTRGLAPLDHQAIIKNNKFMAATMTTTEESKQPQVIPSNKLVISSSKDKEVSRKDGIRARSRAAISKSGKTMPEGSPSKVKVLDSSKIVRAQDVDSNYLQVNQQSHSDPDAAATDSTAHLTSAMDEDLNARSDEFGDDAKDSRDDTQSPKRAERDYQSMIVSSQANQVDAGQD